MTKSTAGLPARLATALWWGRLAASAGVAALLGIVGLSVPAAAQQGVPSAAPAERRIAFDIPGQDLNSALLAFAGVAGGRCGSPDGR